MRLALSFSLFFIPVLCALAQPHLHFQNYGLEDGLSQITSMSLAEDDQGYIWVGTADGLNHFNGYEFKIYRNSLGDSSSLSSRYVSDNSVLLFFFSNL